MARLADEGARVVLVVATQGDRGEAAGLVSGPALGRMRAVETQRAAAELGVARVSFLGYGESGLTKGPPPSGSFAAAPVAEAAGRLSAVLRDERPDALVVYDDHGIYEHPDHVQVHTVGWVAATMSETRTVYETTVDREYLHFVETHVVEEAGRAAARAMGGADVGLPTVEIDLTVDVRHVIEAKRCAIAAHGSQLPAGSAVMQLHEATFAEVYGWEWYRRAGAAGPLDALT
jgi:LmbE family N-acetylglucosaminyl deacetylase